MERPFRVYGHRGAAAHHPENTARSFEAALAHGADALETDVRMSRDGEIIVFHDADGKRTCGVDRRLVDCSWSEIRTWDAGEGEHPLRLDDLLERWPDTFVNIDIKDNSVEAAARTLAIVAGHTQSVGIGTFHTKVARFAAANFRGQLALVTREVVAARFLPESAARRLVRGNAAQIPSIGWIGLDDARFVNKLHRLGCRVDYWTIDDPDRAVELTRRGANGIVTNDPQTIIAALAAAGLR